MTCATSALCRQFLLEGIREKQVVLDVGCGAGALMVELARRGCLVQGVEIDPARVEECRGKGLDVKEGRAETLPLADRSMDVVVCSVVVPYTDERRAVAEWARVVKPGGRVNVTLHGLGYGVACLFRGPGVKRRLYGARMLVNTWWYGLVGRRLPGFFGDTLCQTSSRMKAYYRENGLTLQQEQVVGLIAGLPQFLCHFILKEGERQDLASCE